MSALREAFIEELMDIYDAENQLLKALPKMARAARNDSVRAAFQRHEEETRKQVWRLGQVFEAFDEQARGKHCKGMKGLIAEAQDIIDENEGDAALIAAAQKAEHYEIAVYGTLASWAVALGQEPVVEFLTQTLSEEKEADHKLTAIAQSVVNSQESWRDAEEARPKRRTTNRRRARVSAKGGRSAGPARRSASRKSTLQARRQPRSKRLRAQRGQSAKR